MSKIYGIPVSGSRSGGSGANGKSAYELAVAEGFEGSVTQWLQSLVGKQGEQGVPGEQGPAGADAPADTYLPKDGSEAMTGPLPMGGNRITNAGTPVEAADGATKDYVDGLLAHKSIALKAYPVGSIYLSVNGISPASLFGGTWEQITQRFLWAADDSGGYPVGSTGGEKTHTLTVNEMPSHGHNLESKVILYTDRSAAISETPAAEGPYVRSGVITASAQGGGAAHNNMPPYLAVYMWKRTA